MAFAHALAYNNSVWYPYSATGQPVWTPAANWGWGGIVSANPNTTSVTFGQDSCYNSHDVKITWDVYSFNTYYDSSGTPHPIGATVSDWNTKGTGCPSDGYPSTATVTAADGSGYTYVLKADTLGGSTYVYAPSGDTSWVFAQGVYTGGSSVADSNSNTQASPFLPM